MENKDQYNQLIQSLRLVEVSPDIQIRLLPQFVNIADEIALVYDDAFLIASELKERNIISSDTFKILTELNELFEKMSIDKSLWSVEMLRTNIDWERTRKIAGQVLKELHEPLDKPNLDFIVWIKKDR